MYHQCHHHHQSGGIWCWLTSWKLLVVYISISIAATSGSIGLVQGFRNHNLNSTLIFPSRDNNNKNQATPAPPARVLACGSRLKLEIRSICNSHQRENSSQQSQQGHVRGYYSPENPKILKHQRRERNDVDTERSEGNLLRKIITRVARGVIEECCRKPCDRQSLLKYCSSSQEKSDQPSVRESSSSNQFQSIETTENLGLNGAETDKNESSILPLLLQLLWEWESWEKPYSANMMNYHPQKLLKLVQSRSHNCSRVRAISAREVKSNRNSFPRSRHSPSSDETRRDSQLSHESNDEFVFPMEHNTSPLETLAVTVTDEPLSQVFPISAGTNVNDYTG